MRKSLYLLGSGGHASVLVDALKEEGEVVTTILSPDDISTRKAFVDIARLDNENVIFSYDHEESLLVNGIGSLPGNTLRKNIFCKFIERGYSFKKVISQHAVVSSYAEIGHGVQIMTGAIVQAGAVIGDNSIINTGAIIEHDCVIGKHNHVAPGVTLSGAVITGDNVHIGTGAVVIQGIKIGHNVVISAGAIVTKCVENEKIVFGARMNIQDKRGKS